MIKKEAMQGKVVQIHYSPRYCMFGQILSANPKKIANPLHWREGEEAEEDKSGYFAW